MPKGDPAFLLQPQSAQSAEQNLRVAEDAEEEMGERKVSANELIHLTEKIIGFSISIHRALGPGFVERIYEHALAHELRKRDVPFMRQTPISVRYDGIELGAQRVDFLVSGEVIVELKSVSEINAIHEAQLLSYLKAADKRVGLILNFAKPRLDIKRVVNKF